MLRSTRNASDQMTKRDACRISWLRPLRERARVLNIGRLTIWLGIITPLECRDILASAEGREVIMSAMLGQSRPFLLVMEQLQRYAGCDVHILVEGETGTGKELAA